MENNYIIGTIVEHPEENMLRLLYSEEELKKCLSGLNLVPGDKIKILLTKEEC